MRQRRKKLIVLELAAIGLALMILIPFLMILVNSFKDIRESALFGMSLLTEWQFSNFKDIFAQAHIVRGFMDSFLISGCVVLCVNVFASMLLSLFNEETVAFCVHRTIFSSWA